MEERLKDNLTIARFLLRFVKSRIDEDDPRQEDRLQTARIMRNGPPRALIGWAELMSRRGGFSREFAEARERIGRAWLRKYTLQEWA